MGSRTAARTIRAGAARATGSHSPVAVKSWAALGMEASDMLVVLGRISVRKAAGPGRLA